MPDDTSNPIGDKDVEQWITIGGKKMRVDAGEDQEKNTRSPMPSLRGEKEHNTKEAQKMYKTRFDLIKSIFKPRDEVVFAQYKKSGVIMGIEGSIANILSEGRHYPVTKNHVFKKSELIGDRHWDTMTNVDRVESLKAHHLPSFYNKQNWGNLSWEVRQALLSKNVSPAGTTTSTTGVHNPIYNPINEEKSVSDRIDEEIARQHKDTGHSEDEAKGKD